MNQYIVGIKKEERTLWERRSPLTPQDTAQLIQKHPNLQFIVEQSKNRIFSEKQFLKAGCKIQDDLSECQVILGIKDMPPSSLYNNKTYMFFSHSTKAQRESMPLLDEIIKKNITMIDYEKICDQNGNRLIAFGRIAGIAGAISFLSGLGMNLLERGFSTPFINISSPHKYMNINQAFQMLKDVGDLIVQQQIPEEIAPLIIGITGSTGRAGKGVFELLNTLPITVIDADQIENLVKDKANPKHKTTIYVTKFDLNHLVRSEDSKPFDRKNYYEHPTKFIPIFQDKYLPYLSVIFHCIYWDHKYPRMITNNQLQQLKQENRLRLLGIADISCDKDGSIQLLKKYTTPESPFFYYDPIKETTEYEKPSLEKIPNFILYQAVDILSTEFPFDASEYFSGILKDYIYDIASNHSKIEEHLLPEPIYRAVITANGDLTANYKYIRHLRKMNQQLMHSSHYHPEKVVKPLKKVRSFCTFSLVGHLFKSNAIQNFINLVQEFSVDFNLVDIKVGKFNSEELSSVNFQIFTNSQEEMNKIIDEIARLAETHQIMFDEQN